MPKPSQLVLSHFIFSEADTLTSYTIILVFLPYPSYPIFQFSLIHLGILISTTINFLDIKFSCLTF